MTPERVAGICFCILITSAIADGQQQSNTTGQRQYGRGESAVESTYWADGVAPLRRVQTRSESDGRKVVVETVEGPDIEGRWVTFEEVVTETTAGPRTTRTRQDVFRPTVNGRQRLSETSESRWETRPNGNTSAVHSTWVRDLNGHLRLRERLIEDTRSLASDAQRTESTLLLPSINETLQETERIDSTTRRIKPGVVQNESTHLRRDINGGWKAIEIRQGEGREIGTSEQVEEETIQRPDMNGNLAVAEVRVIRSSRTKEQEQVVTETYAPQTDVVSLNGRPPLSVRVHVTTTLTADGGRYTVEEVEARSRVSPNDPLRVVRRTVTTSSPSGPGQWVTQRQVFEPDLNGRMQLVRIE
jgi:hypothetical protein